jgi:hypothetical protein
MFPHLIVRLSLPPRLLVRRCRGCRLSELKFAGDISILASSLLSILEVLPGG